MSNELGFSKSVTDSSTDIKEMGKLGDRIRVEGVKYVLCKASGSLDVGTACQAAAAAYEVVTGVASTDQVEGWNLTGASVADNGYFWMAYKGLVAAAPSAIFGTDADLSALAPLAINSDGLLADLASNANALLSGLLAPFGHSIATRTANATVTQAVVINAYGWGDG